MTNQTTQNRIYEIVSVMRGLQDSVASLKQEGLIYQKFLQVLSMSKAAIFALENNADSAAELRAWFLAEAMVLGSTISRLERKKGQWTKG